MDGRPSWVLRQLRWLAASRNPLARRWDRLEAGLVVLAIVLSLIALPFALSLGSQTYARGLAEAAQESSSRVRSTAVLLEDVPDPIGAQPATAPEPANGVWRLPDGSDRTGQVFAPPGSTAGTRVPIWLDRAGNRVDPPLSGQDAVGGAVGVALFGWVGFTAAVALLVWAARFVLDRRRYRGWAREWERVGRGLERF